MNPTNQPVSFYGDNSRSTDGALLAALASKDYYAPALDGATNSAIGCTRDQIGDVKGLVKDVGANVREAIREAEAQIRSDVRQEGQEAVGATKDAQSAILSKIGDAECHITQKLGDVECKIIKENSDQTLYLTNQLAVIREQGIRNEYETKLSREQTIKEVTARIDYKYDRLNDQIHHVEDKLQHCCCEQELANSTQTGLLNLIVNALNVGGLSK